MAMENSLALSDFKPPLVGNNTLGSIYILRKDIRVGGGSENGNFPIFRNIKMVPYSYLLRISPRIKELFHGLQTHNEGLNHQISNVLGRNRQPAVPNNSGY